MLTLAIITVISKALVPRIPATNVISPSLRTNYREQVQTVVSQPWISTHNMGNNHKNGIAKTGSLSVFYQHLGQGPKNSKML